MKPYLDRILDCPNGRAEVALQGLYMNLAESIQAIRMEQGISQAELAGAIGTTQSGVARFENTALCSFTLRSLARIAEALGYSLQVKLVKREVDRVYWEVVDAKKSWRVYDDGCCGDLEEAKEEVEACLRDASFGDYKVRYYEARWLEESLVEKWE